MSALCYEVGADAYLCLQTATTRTFLWTLARAVERHQLIGENRRLAQTERNRGQQEQGEAERLLAAQRGLIGNCSRTVSGPGALQSAALPEALRTHYRELLRAHVIMGSGNLSAEMAALASALAGARVPAADILSLHVEVVEDLVRSLGSRGARHIISRRPVDPGTARQPGGVSSHSRRLKEVNRRNSALDSLLTFAALHTGAVGTVAGGRVFAGRERMWSPSRCSRRSRIGPPATLVERLPWAAARDQAVAAAADQVLPAGLLERLAHLEVVLRLEELHQRPLHLAVAQVLGDVDLLHR